MLWFACAESEVSKWHASADGLVRHYQRQALQTTPTLVKRVGKRGGQRSSLKYT
jgi:hypothetical protein